MAFADHYPLAMFQAAAALHGDDAEKRAAFKAHREQVFAPALLTHLTILRRDGRLGVITGLKGRDVWIATCWNEFVAGERIDPWLTDMIGNRLIIAAAVALKFSRTIGGIDKSEDLSLDERIEINWRRMCEMLDAGNTCEFDWRIDDIRDGKSGERAILQIADWQPTLMIFDDKFNLHPAQDVEAIPLSAAEFDMPSGRLLISDFLRVEGFKDGTGFEPDRDYGELDLNSERGRAALTVAHAADHNLGFAQTTNTCCVVHRHPETGFVLISDRWNADEENEDSDGDAEAPGWEKVGTFSCDVWRITAIDRDIALARMADGGNEKAEETLDTYLASDDCYAQNVVQINVPAGRWRIHAGANFHKRVDRERFGIPETISPWALLEPVAA